MMTRLEWWKWYSTEAAYMAERSRNQFIKLEARRAYQSRSQELYACARDLLAIIIQKGY